MNAVAKKDSQEVATQAQAPQGEQILASDIIIPKLWLMQGLSDLVAADKAKAGEIRRSTNEELVGGPNSPVEFIPITFQNKWVIQEKVGKKFEYRKTVSRDGGLQDAMKIITDRTGENLEWEFQHNGTDWKRVKVLNVFALLVNDIKAEQAEFEKFKKTGEVPDLNKTLLPVVISFRSTSYNAGKTVVSHFAKAMAPAQQRFGVKAYHYTQVLKCYQDKNDQGSFYVYEVVQGRKCTNEKTGAPEFERASEWASRLTQMPVIKIDESDEVKVDTAENANSRF